MTSLSRNLPNIKEIDFKCRIFLELFKMHLSTLTKLSRENSVITIEYIVRQRLNKDIVRLDPLLNAISILAFIITVLLRNVVVTVLVTLWGKPEGK